MNGLRWLVACGLLALVAVGVVFGILQEGGDEDRGPRSDASAALSPSAYPNLGRCLDYRDAAAEDDQGFEIEAIAEKVERLRGLRFSEPPEVELLEQDELESRLRDEFEREYSRSDAEVDRRTLTLLGAIPEGEDLYEIYGDAIAGQVAGVYDPRTGELLVSAEEEPGVLERITLAHELEHALADQALGLPVPDDPDPAHADSLLAATALVEGDATLTMELYAVRHVGFGDLLGTLDAASLFGAAEQELARLPYIVQQQLIWPYVDGAEFVCHLYATGGWRAVDRAYREPPRSSDQILFPARYGESVADPPDPQPLAEPWSRRGRAEFGAAQLLWLFQAPGGDPDRALPRSRALVEPWRGGELHLWTRGEESAAGIVLLARRGSAALCAGVSGWYASAFPDAERRPLERGGGLVSEAPEQAAVVRCPAGEVQVGIAPDLETAQRLAGS